MKRNYTAQELISFEDRVKEAYEAGQIKGPIHLSRNNEEQLIELFKNISEDDWVFSAWRNHYHALLHGVDPEYLFDSISEGKSMGTNNVKPNFYASSIVGGIIPIALGGYAVKMGYNVLHYTLELGEDYVGRRYDAFFTSRGFETSFPVENIPDVVPVKRFFPVSASIWNNP